MEKKMLAVQGLDGKKRVACPKCDTEMIFTSSGGMHFDRGDVWDDIEEYFVCPACGHEIEEIEPVLEKA